MSIIDNIANAFNTKFSGQINDAVKSHGNWLIVDVVYICREPIMSFIKKFIRMFASGALHDLKRYGFDNFFHLYAILKLKNPQNGEIIYMKTEKNQTINIEFNKSLEKLLSKDNHMFKLHGTYNDMTVEMLFYLMHQAMGNALYSYDHINNNCQVYVYNLCNILFKYNYKTDLPSIITNYIMQPVQDILHKYKFMNSIAKTITDISGFFTRMSGGDFRMSGGDFKIRKNNNKNTYKVTNPKTKRVYAYKTKNPTKLMQAVEINSKKISS